jgi:hypothetical protein
MISAYFFKPTSWIAPADTGSIPRGRSVVRSFSWVADGGCESAEIEISGDWNSLHGATQRIGERVWLKDENGDVVWWGYVATASVGGNTVSIEPLYNRVTVSWDDGTTTGVTAPISDALSIAKYGIKETVIAGGKITAAAAATLAQRFLSARSRPINAASSIEWQAEPVAILTCLGYASYLNWRRMDSFATAGISPTEVIMANCVSLSQLAGITAPVTGVTTQREEAATALEQFKKAMIIGTAAGLGLRAYVTTAGYMVVTTEPLGRSPILDRPFLLADRDNYSTAERIPIRKSMIPRTVCGSWVYRSDESQLAKVYGANRDLFFADRMVYNGDGSINLYTREVKIGYENW